MTNSTYPFKSKKIIFFQYMTIPVTSKFEHNMYVYILPIQSMSFWIADTLDIFSFLCRPKYKLSHVEILHGHRIRHWKHLDFLFKFYETSKCYFSKIIIQDFIVHGI
jgi:hypothetical protein